MENETERQRVYLLAREILKRVLSERKIDLSFAEKLNRKNAEMLFCDCLPIK